MSFFDLSGKTALVTGASRGIGAAVAKRLAKAGARVIVNYRSNQEAAEKVLKEIQADSPNSIAVNFDVADEKQMAELLPKLLEQVGSIEIVVANAGISRDSLLPRSTAEHFQEVIQTNLMGTIHLVRLLSRSMMKQRYGRIICIGSVVGEMGNKGQSAYAASKSGLFGFAKSVAQELGSRGVTCNVLCPGFIKTEMTNALDEATQKAYFDSIPAGRFGESEEIAAGVHFLASEEAGYITGATLDINGGLVML
jgi:3-oxoacyl-[acyl-carrier protein] reductase